MPLSWNDIKSKALAFSKRWADARSEDSEAKPFWIDFFDLFGITDRRVATFEHAVKKLPGAKARTDGFIDLFWPGMLLVEHKSRGRDLDQAMEQALSYLPGIAERDLPQIIIVCDFARFRVRQLASGETREFALADLHKHIRLFGFVAGYKTQTIKPQDPVNIKAAERMGKLHDALKASGYEGHALEVLLVRLLFCLFADDTGIFQPAQAFRSLVEERTETDGSDLGARLAQLFQTLNTPEDKRSRALDAQVAAFPYVNGRLFEEILPMAEFDAAMREALLDACALDWSAISPAIFGSLFQSIMDRNARRNLGAYYTSEENILKLIKPLFLDALWAEFERVKGNRNRLFEFHKKLRGLTFFDPACGCGNFLVISYRELRLLELEVLRASYQDGQQNLDVHQLISVNVDQFHGIEIEEFPAQIAQVALWLVDHQMNLQVSEEFGQYFARIPLRESPHIVHGNALRLDWNDVLPAGRCSYLLGNPPFVGRQHLDQAQRSDVAPLYARLERGGTLDFVAAWYIKGADYARLNPSLEVGYVSTNSIVQGEQVGVLWSWMLAQGMHINFAHQTFRWSNEAGGAAAVHCVIISFAAQARAEKWIYEYAQIDGAPLAVRANHINAYLMDAADVCLVSRRQSICPVPPVVFGSMANDGGHFFLDDAEKAALLEECPAAGDWIRPFLGADEFINNIPRWCLWLKDCPPGKLRAMPPVMARVQQVKALRQASNRAATQALAATPTLFGEIRQPEGTFLLIPRHSSERREIIPMGFLTSDVIVGDANLCMPDATLCHFGVMTSRMHMAWVKIVCGRIRNDYRYTSQIVYNNFPWPDLPGDAEPGSPAHKASAAIEAAAQGVLDARAQFQQGPNPSSLADLYDPLTMPPALLRAHHRLDVAVDKAYEACGGRKSYKSDAERVAYLFERYQQLTSLLPVARPRTARRRS